MHAMTSVASTTCCPLRAVSTDRKRVLPNPRKRGTSTRYPRVNGHRELPVGGQENCPVADTNLPMRVASATGPSGSAQGFDSFPVQGLGQAHGVATGLAQVGVV